MDAELEHAKVSPGLVPPFVDLPLVLQRQVEEHDPVNSHQHLRTCMFYALRIRSGQCANGPDITEQRATELPGCLSGVDYDAVVCIRTFQSRETGRLARCWHGEFLDCPPGQQHRNALFAVIGICEHLLWRERAFVHAWAPRLAYTGGSGTGRRHAQLALARASEHIHIDTIYIDVFTKHAVGTARKSRGVGNKNNRRTCMPWRSSGGSGRDRSPEPAA